MKTITSTNVRVELILQHGHLDVTVHLDKELGEVCVSLTIPGKKEPQDMWTIPYIVNEGISRILRNLQVNNGSYSYIGIFDFATKLESTILSLVTAHQMTYHRINYVPAYRSVTARIDCDLVKIYHADYSRDETLSEFLGSYKNFI